MDTPGDRKRFFHSLSFKGAHYRFCGAEVQLLSRTIRTLRGELEHYIRRFPDFGSSLEAFTDREQLPADPPESALRMHMASLAVYRGTGGEFSVGPMAAVAGTFAELSVEAVLSSLSQNTPNSERAREGVNNSARDIVLENGGDIFMLLQRPIDIALFAGPESPFARLAFHIEPEGEDKERKRRAVCSSSAKMGHSLSFGCCDLATVFSPSASLADAAATALCNSIGSSEDIGERLETVLKIEGVDGAVAVYGDKLGRVGAVPPLVQHSDPELTLKIV